MNLLHFVSIPSALADNVNYPKIREKGPGPSPVAQGIFSFLVNNFPWVLVGIAVLLTILAICAAKRRNR